MTAGVWRQRASTACEDHAPASWATRQGLSGIVFRPTPFALQTHTTHTRARTHARAHSSAVKTYPAALVAGAEEVIVLLQVRAQVRLARRVALRALL